MSKRYNGTNRINFNTITVVYCKKEFIHSEINLNEQQYHINYSSLTTRRKMNKLRALTTMMNRLVMNRVEEIIAIQVFLINFIRPLNRIIMGHIFKNICL